MVRAVLSAFLQMDFVPRKAQVTDECYIRTRAGCTHPFPRDLVALITRNEKYHRSLIDFFSMRSRLRSGRSGPEYLKIDDDGTRQLAQPPPLSHVPEFFWTSKFPSFESDLSCVHPLKLHVTMWSSLCPGTTGVQQDHF